MLLQHGLKKLSALVGLNTLRDRWATQRFWKTRGHLSRKFLKGDGLEIGALHEPLPVSEAAKVRYLDRLSHSDLRSQYPELRDQSLVNVDIVDDGETLKSQPAGAWDFVIANHVLEHCEDPIRAVGHWLRVLKPGGHLYLAVPDKRFTFDLPREITTLQHLIDDFEQGPALSRQTHYQDWARHVDSKPEAEIDSHAQKLAAKNYSIHFHVWTANEYRDLLQYLQNEKDYPFTIETFQRNGMEAISILKKTLPTSH